MLSAALYCPVIRKFFDLFCGYVTLAASLRGRQRARRSRAEGCGRTCPLDQEEPGEGGGSAAKQLFGF